MRFIGPYFWLCWRGRNRKGEMKERNGERPKEKGDELGAKKTRE